MRLELKLHPDSVCQAADRIEVELTRPSEDALVLRYSVDGDIARLRPPAIMAPARTDELWKHTCFEAFALEAGGGYTEYNFAPSTQWAAYRFDAYRAGMRNVDAAPSIHVARTEAVFELRASILLPPGVTRLGLSAVIEEMDGTKSYWALAHPSGQPDFHHPDSFAYELAP